MEAQSHVTIGFFAKRLPVCRQSIYLWLERGRFPQPDFVSPTGRQSWRIEHAEEIIRAILAGEVIR